MLHHGCNPGTASLFRYYLSPEICRDEPYGAKSDVWAMGCLLFEMIAFKVPFNGKDLRSLAGEILKSRTPLLPSPHKSNRPLAELVNCCLQKDAKQRPSSNDILTCPCVACPSTCSCLRACAPRRGLWPCRGSR